MQKNIAQIRVHKRRPKVFSKIVKYQVVGVIFE